MISMSHLGNVKTLGRLGNAMFQYAFLRSKANKLGCKYSCPHWWGDDIFDLKENNRVVSPIAQKQKLNLIGEKPGYTNREMEIKPGMDILGYFQSPKYFKREDILNWYEFKPEIQKVKNEYKVQDRIGIHIRRGDYLNFRHVFNILQKDYYLKALKELSERRVALFSDNITLAIQNLKGEHICVMPITTKNAVQDLYLMTQCTGMIMANSSFSWWGAYLNPHQNRIFYPEKWYAPNTKTNPDIAREEWHRI